MYRLDNLTKEQEKIFDNFVKKIYSNTDNPFKTCKNERNLATTFILNINNLLKDLDVTGKEKYEAFHEEVKNEQGRCDIQYGNTIIEFKRFNLLSKKDISNEEAQAQNYLKDKRLSGYFINAFLYDGKHIYHYYKDENDIIHTGANNGLVNHKNIDFFLKTLFQTTSKKLNPFNIKYDFSIVDKNDNVIDNDDVLGLLRVFFNILTTTKLSQRTKLLFKEWEKMFRLAEGDNGKHEDIAERQRVFSLIFGKEITQENEYYALFSLHTTLSIIIKLLLSRMINDYKKLPSFDKYAREDSISETKKFISTVENGQFFKKIGIVNLTDNDFFAWYVKEEWNDELKNSLQNIISKIAQYENIFIANFSKMVDMFKELYQSFIPKCVRHSFGEYYTPYWLAERTFLSTIDNNTDLSSKRFLDPNCGSGTFLSVFFNYKHSNPTGLTNGNRIDFNDYVNDIVGVDINPIAVLMARANVLMQGFRVCNFSIGSKYEIPIYLADSLYSPTVIQVDNIDCFEYNLSTTSLQNDFGIDKINLVLPKKLIMRDDFFEIISLLEKEIVKKDSKKVLKIFEDYSTEIKTSKILKEKIKEIINNLIEFEKKGLNSIWLKIFSNYFKVGTFDKFDYIVGNPAWVQWSVLPENYRENVKANISLDGLFSKDKNVGGNNLNICALIANKTFSKWLKDDGIFAFIMPKSILFNKSFEGFRNLLSSEGKKRRFCLDEVIDFSQCGEIFEGVGIDFCIYKIIQNDKKSIVDMISYSQKKSLFNLYQSQDWNKAKDYFKPNKKTLLELQTSFSNNYLETDTISKAKKLSKLIGINDYKFRKGVNVKYPMRLRFIRKIDSNTGVFNPYTKIGKRLRVDEKQEIELEFRYIKPFVTAPMLKEENTLVWENDYCICPYKVNTKKPLSAKDLKAEAPKTYAYLELVDDLLEGGSNFNKRVQNFDENYGILRMGIYTWGEYFVAIRDNTRLAPNIISQIKTHWGKLLSPLLDNHISYISQGRNEKFIDKSEAEYIYNILNDDDVKEIITKSQDPRSISSRLPISIKYYR